MAAGLSKVKVVLKRYFKHSYNMQNLDGWVNFASLIAVKFEIIKQEC
jgi:hypothetical protein